MHGIELRGAQYLPSGTKVETKVLDPINLNAVISSTEEHEAIHSFLAIERGIGVNNATVNPTSEYLGATFLSRPDAVAAIGPHAAGCDGCGHDLNVVDNIGADRDTAASIARGMISTGAGEIHAIACLLHEKRSVSGAEMEETIRRYRLGNNVLISLETPEGEKIEIYQQGVKDHIFLDVDKIYPVKAPTLSQA